MSQNVGQQATMTMIWIRDYTNQLASWKWFNGDDFCWLSFSLYVCVCLYLCDGVFLAKTFHPHFLSLSDTENEHFHFLSTSARFCCLLSTGEGTTKGSSLNVINDWVLSLWFLDGPVVCVCMGFVTEHWPVFSSTISILLLSFLDFDLTALLLLVSNMLSVYFPIFIEQFFHFF